jgi:hypothetical protein
MGHLVFQDLESDVPGKIFNENGANCNGSVSGFPGAVVAPGTGNFKEGRGQLETILPADTLKFMQELAAPDSLKGETVDRGHGCRLFNLKDSDRWYK